MHHEIMRLIILLGDGKTNWKGKKKFQVCRKPGLVSTIHVSVKVNGCNPSHYLKFLNLYCLMGSLSRRGKVRLSLKAHNAETPTNSMKRGLGILTGVF